MKDNVTIYDIAKEAGVSVTTVTRAFRPDASVGVETRRRILEIAKRYNYRANKAAVMLSHGTVKIGVIIIKLIYSFYSELVRGTETAAKELSVYRIKYDLKLICEDCESTSREILECVDRYIAEKYDGIVVNYSGVDPEVIEKLKQATKAGIKIVSLVSEIPGIEPLFSSINNSEAAGKLAAELMYYMCLNRKVLLFTGNMETTVHRSITKAFCKEAETRGKFDVAGRYDTKDIPELAEIMAREALREHPDAGGIYISSANSVPICRYLDEHGYKGRIPVIASDIFPELARYVSAGVVNATIFQNPFKQAKTAFDNLFYSLAYGTKVPARLIIIPQVIMKSTIDFYTGDQDGK